MELVHGRTVQDLIESTGRLPVVEAIRKALDLLEGLEHLHASSAIHRDVKPSNVFVDAHGRAKLGDFGCARTLGADGRLTAHGSFVGTPWYASPEQIRREETGFATDIYSASATLHAMLAGRPPFFGENVSTAMRRILDDPPSPLRSIRTDVPVALDTAIRRGLGKSPRERWSNATALRRELEAFGD